MKRRLITLLMVVAMLASVAVIASAERLLVDAEVELGDFTWLNSDTQKGWRNDVMYAREFEDDGASEVTLTAGEMLKASHLVIELSEAPAGMMQIVWQSNFAPQGWNWYQSDIPLEDLELMLDGTTLTIPLPYYFNFYNEYLSIALRTDSAPYEAQGGTFGALKTDEELTEEGVEVKFLIGYYEMDDVADFIVSAKLTYGPVGAHPNPAGTYTLPEPGTGPGTISWSTQFAQAAGDATPGVTLRKDVFASARGITLVVDPAVFDESEIVWGMQSMDAWNGDDQWKPVDYAYDGEGNIDIYLSAFAGGGGWDHFKNPENLHGKFVFQTDSGSLEEAFQSAYIWWTAPVRGDVEEVTEPAGEDETEPAGDDGETPTEAPTTAAPASTDDEGGSAILWILIAGAAVVVIIIIIVVVSKGKKK